MTSIQISRGSLDRRVAKEPYIALRNRFCEENPLLNTDPVSLIARPALKRWMIVGSGPIRRVYSQPGTFGDNLFVVSGDDLYRIDNGSNATFIGTTGNGVLSTPSMAATARIGDGEDAVPEYLYLTDGGILWLYVEEGFSQGTLTFGGAVVDNDTISMGGVYYKWTSGSVDTGTPDGTSGFPWLVTLGVDNITSLTTMLRAVNASGEEGVDYSTGLTQNEFVTANGAVGNSLYIWARTAGAGGDTIAVTEATTNGTWSNPTLEDGGDPMLSQVYLPNDVGAISVAFINGYVVVIPSQIDGLRGRFYWINPGETTVDPLDFATAERSPDPIHQVVVFGEMFWLLGEATTEPWITSGNPDTPMQRFQGILYDRGSWEGTAIQVKDALFVIDTDGAVFKVSGGLERLSSPNIEERLRLAIQNAAFS